jgi:hypothetical protein
MGEAKRRKDLGLMSYQKHPVKFMYQPPDKWDNVGMYLMFVCAILSGGTGIYLFFH